MTDSNKPGSRQVLDPAWEEELRRGQEAEGEAGSVEPELEMVHLLRHLREPETISPEALDTIWTDIEAEVAPKGVAWWRKAWIWWAAPAAAAAAVLVIAVIPPNKDEGTVARNDDMASEDKAAPAPMAEKSEDADARREGAAKDELGEAEEAEPSSATAVPGGMDGVGSQSRGAVAQNAFEANYVRLEPHGRAAIRVAVDASRDDLRDQLLAKARGGGR